MRKPLAVWLVLAVFGVMLWAAGSGVGTHPLYRLALAFGMMTWLGWLAWVPKSS